MIRIGITFHFLEFSCIFKKNQLMEAIYYRDQGIVIGSRGGEKKFG